MPHNLQQQALSNLEDVFGERMERPVLRDGQPADPDNPLALVRPVNDEEVELLARLARRYSLPLVALGAGTYPDPERGPDTAGSVLIRFDLMRRIRLPDAPDELWAEAEPGALWLELDNGLRIRGKGLAVYPSSAPRATIGGWLALDGLGVGSFEYGWLHENVLSADVVLPAGGRLTVRGEDLQPFVGPAEESSRRRSTGIVVSARLRVRHASTDVPFAGAFGDSEGLVGAVSAIAKASVPLWHLGFLNPQMSRSRGLGDDHLLFGAYPKERAEEVEEDLKGVIESSGGGLLGSADAYRVWAERFFPIAPSRPTPKVLAREFVSVTKLKDKLASSSRAKRVEAEDGAAVQGTVAGSGEALLLTLDPKEEGQ